MAVSGLHNLARMTTATAGTGTITLGSAVSGFLTFADAGVSDGDVVSYAITDGSNSEVGRGTYTASGTTLARTTVVNSTNAGSAISLSGSAQVMITVLAEDVEEALQQGVHTIWVPASAMTARTTNGAEATTAELATNDVALATMNFDTATEEGVGFFIGMPNSWNEGTVTFIPYWTAASGSGTVVFELAGNASSNDEALDTAVGTAQSSTDTFIAANDCHIGPQSSAITIGGTPAPGDLVYFEITRDVATDTLGVDAQLIGIQLLITLNAGTDA